MCEEHASFESGVLRAFSGALQSGLQGKCLCAEQPLTRKNVSQVQASRRGLNRDAGSGNEKKGTEMRNLVMEGKKKSLGLGSRADGEERGRMSECGWK